MHLPATVISSTSAVATGPNWLDLAKIPQSNFHDRRNHQWKIGFGLWLAIGAFTYVMLSGDNQHLGQFHKVEIFRSYFVIAILDSGANYFIHCGNAYDKSWMQYYIQKAEGIADSLNERPQMRRSLLLKGVGWLWLVVHCGFTIILLVMSYTVLTDSRARESKPRYELKLEIR